jgi:hypothetical protein
MMSVPQGELPAPDGMTPDFAHPKDLLYTINQVSSILSIVLITLFVFVRLYIKAKILKSVNREDCKFNPALCGPNHDKSTDSQIRDLPRSMGNSANPKTYLYTHSALDLVNSVSCMRDLS